MENLIPRVNQDIARWMKAGDMVLGGVNVTTALAKVDLPLLVIVSNRDGNDQEAWSTNMDVWVASAEGGKAERLTTNRAADIARSFQLFPSFLRQLRPLVADLGTLAEQGTPLMNSQRSG